MFHLLVFAAKRGNASKIYQFQRNLVQNYFALWHENCSKNTREKIVPLMSPSLLESLNSDYDITGHEIDLFELAQQWAESSDSIGWDASDSLPPSKRQKKDSPGGEQVAETRKTIASSLVEKYIRLDRIVPEDLQEAVEPSGLVRTERVMEIYKKHSLALGEERKLTFDTVRGAYWDHSCTDIVESGGYGMKDFLHCHEMQSGIHTWSNMVLEGGLSTCLGIALDGELNRYISLHQGGAWWYSAAGKKILKSEEKGGLLEFRDGCTVTFELDLTKSGV